MNCTFSLSLTCNPRRQWVVGLNTEAQVGVKKGEEEAEAPRLHKLRDEPPELLLVQIQHPGQQRDALRPAENHGAS